MERARGIHVYTHTYTNPVRREEEMSSRVLERRSRRSSFKSRCVCNILLFLPVISSPSLSLSHSIFLFPPESLFFLFSQNFLALRKKTMKKNLNNFCTTKNEVTLKIDTSCILFRFLKKGKEGACAKVECSTPFCAIALNGTKAQRTAIRLVRTHCWDKHFSFFSISFSLSFLYVCWWSSSIVFLFLSLSMYLKADSGIYYYVYRQSSLIRKTSDANFASVK